MKTTRLHECRVTKLQAVNMKKMSQQLRWKAEITAVTLARSSESSAQGAHFSNILWLAPKRVIWNITKVWSSVFPISNVSWKCHYSPFRTFPVILLPNRQTNTTCSAEVKTVQVNQQQEYGACRQQEYKVTQQRRLLHDQSPVALILFVSVFVSLL